MRESLGTGGDDNRSLYEELGLTDLYGIESQTFDKDPILSGRIEGEGAPRTASAFIRYFANRDYPGSPAEGYHGLARTFIEQVRNVAGNKPDENEKGIVPKVERIDIKSHDTTGITDNLAELYDFEQIPATGTFIDSALYLLKARFIGNYQGADKSDRTVYAGRLYDADRGEDDQVYIIEIQSQDEKLGGFTSYELRSAIPNSIITPNAPVPQQATEVIKPNPQDISEINSLKMLQYFDAQEESEAEYEGYHELAANVIRQIKLLSSESTSENPRSEVPLLVKPVLKNGPSDDELHGMTVAEYGEHLKSVDSARLYDGVEPKPTRDLMLLAENVLEQPQKIPSLDPDTGYGHVLTHGKFGDKTLCFVEEYGTDGLGDYKAWQLYSYIPTELILVREQRPFLTTGEQKEMWNGLLEILNSRPTTEEPQTKRVKKEKKQKEQP
jgi:hypothetical protein